MHIYLSIKRGRVSAFPNQAYILCLYVFSFPTNFVGGISSSGCFRNRFFMIALLLSSLVISWNMPDVKTVDVYSPSTSIDWPLSDNLVLARWGEWGGKILKKKHNCFCTPCSWQQEEDDGAWWDWHFSCTQAFQQLTPLSQSHPQNADLQVLFCCLSTV